MTSPGLIDWIARQRWFRSKTRARSGGEIVESVQVGELSLTFVRVRYVDGGSETYVVGLAPIANDKPGIPEHARIGDGTYDALATGELADRMLAAIRDQQAIGPLHTSRTGVDLDRVPAARVGTAEQTNTAMFFGDRLIMKVYRSIVEGENPEVEILRFLAAHPSVPTPRLAGEIEYRGAAVAMVQTFVPSKGDAWSATLESIAAYLADPTRLAGEVERARRLGTRTAALHRALATATDDPAFASESMDNCEKIVATARENLDRLVRTLRTRGDLVQHDTRAPVDTLLTHASELNGRLSRAASMTLATKRTRIHGDYHLGQVLVTPDDDFVIIDFEGEPARSIAERREKSMPLRDVAGMLRSFDYAAVTALRAATPRAAHLVAAWKRAVSEAFVAAWREGVAGSDAAPASDEEARVLLDLFLVDKGIYEVAYELDNRPGWLSIPVEGLLSLLEGLEVGQAAAATGRRGEGGGHGVLSGSRCVEQRHS